MRVEGLAVEGLKIVKWEGRREVESREEKEILFLCSNWRNQSDQNESCEGEGEGEREREGV